MRASAAMRTTFAEAALHPSEESEKLRPTGAQNGAPKTVAELPTQQPAPKPVADRVSVPPLAASAPPLCDAGRKNPVGQNNMPTCILEPCIRTLQTWPVCSQQVLLDSDNPLIEMGGMLRAARAT